MKLVIRFLPAFGLAALLAVAAAVRPSPTQQEKDVPEPAVMEELGTAQADAAAPLPEPDVAAEILGNRKADADHRLDAVEALIPDEETERELTDEDFVVFRRIIMDRTENPTVRMGVLIRLGKSGDARALGPLSDFFHGFPDYEARHIVVKALGDLDQPDAREILVEALKNEPGDGPRAQAARALESPELSEEERSALRGAVLGDHCENVQLAALGVLIRAGSEGDFLHTVTALTTTKERVRKLAARGLQGP